MCNNRLRSWASQYYLHQLYFGLVEIRSLTRECAAKRVNAAVKTAATDRGLGDKAFDAANTLERLDPERVSQPADQQPARQIKLPLTASGLPQLKFEEPYVVYEGRPHQFAPVEYRMLKALYKADGDWLGTSAFSAVQCSTPKETKFALKRTLARAQIPIDIVNKRGCGYALRCSVTWAAQHTLDGPNTESE